LIFKRLATDKTSAFTKRKSKGIKTANFAQLLSCACVLVHAGLYWWR